MIKQLILLFSVFYTVSVHAFGFKFNLLKNNYIKNFGTYRAYANESFEKSCLSYKNSVDYSGQTGDGVYRIKPDNGTTIDVYCDMTNGGYTEVFDLTRTPSLSLSEIVSKLQQFNLSDTLSTSTFVLNTNGLFWFNQTISTSGYSVGISRINFSNVIILYNYPIGPNVNQGLVTLHNENKTNCSGNISLSTSCYQTAYSISSLKPFEFSDFTTGANDWHLIVNGSGTNYLGSKSDTVSFSMTNPMYITMAGRIENSTSYNANFYIRALKLK